MVNFTFNGCQVLHNGRRIGWVTRTMEKKRVFMSPRDRAKHYFRNFDGWGINNDLLDWLEQNGFDEIHLKIHESETLISQISKWREHGIPVHYKPHEPQTVLPEKFMLKFRLSIAEISERMK